MPLSDLSDPAATTGYLTLAGLIGAGLIKGGDWLFSRVKDHRDAEAVRLGRRRSDSLAPYAQQIADLRQQLAAAEQKQAAAEKAADDRIERLTAENIACEKKAARLEAKVEFLEANATAMRADIAELKAILKTHGLRDGSGLHPAV